MKHLKHVGVVIATLSLGLTGCITSQNAYTGQTQASKAVIGTGLGAAAGAVAGAVIGNNVGGGDARRGALIGAGLGALSGGGVGLYMDQQEAALRQQLQNTGVSVTRQGNNIILNMPSNVTFATNQDQVNPGFFATLDSVSLVLAKFDKTYVDISGHTDSSGSDQYNLALSQRRAQSVAGYLGSKGVNAQRFLVTGYGEARPIADNQSEQGKAANRRVEIQLTPLT